MAVIRITRYSVDPADTEELLTRRAALISAVRAAFPGLTEARLARLDEQTWVDIWRWDSAEHAQAAFSAAPALPEAQAAFAFAKDATAEQAEIVDER
jgi:quinol monooxygenase YgiN